MRIFPLRHVFPALLVAGLMAMVLTAHTILLPIPAARSQPAGEPFTVTGVAVDADAETTTAAREQAFRQGARIALAQLLSDLAAAEPPVDAATLPQDQIDVLIQAFEVEEERTSPGRYRATLTYIFREDAIRGLLGPEAAAAVAETPAPRPAPPVLVLPVLRSERGDRLWDSPNPWHEAWLDYDASGGPVPILVPFGDLADVADVDVDRALAGDAEALAAIRNRYDAASTIVAVAEPAEGRVIIRLARYGAMEDLGTTTLNMANEQALPGALAAAVGRVADQLAADWRDAAAVPAGPTRTLTVLVLFEQNRDWFRIRSRLRAIPALVETEVASLSPQEAVVELAYRGEERDFLMDLTRQGLVLSEGPAAPELRLVRE
ncbi:MAG: DUF2066 domain-containing protein [Alphaproteobacteria bacterium]|jgi:hypothetical protein|nr:DUF2066 domain-containing protein [Alphaproteobacteria bacterium]